MRTSFQYDISGPGGRPRRKGAFTLVELLIVVSIIISLIAILLPAMGHLKNRARATTTQNLMTQLMHSIESYFTRFDAYPGPAPAASFGPGQPCTAVLGANKISGSQNMLLGLSYAMTPSSASPNVLIPGSASAYVNPASPTGPINYAAALATGSFEQLPPFFTPTPAQLPPPSGANAWPAGGLANCNAATFAFPVVLDAFQDGLPILYYRRSPGVDNPASNDPSTVAAYYLNENSEYTGATNLKSSSGNTFDQTATPFNSAALAGTVQVSGGTAHGGFLLLSAGIDRFYGTTGDNITLVGGN